MDKTKVRETPRQAIVRASNIGIMFEIEDRILNIEVQCETLRNMLSKAGQDPDAITVLFEAIDAQAQAAVLRLKETLHPTLYGG